jgi:DNA-binding transcriptional ArsR family regulator
MNMGATKETGYAAKDLAVARYAKALSHPARVAILDLLLKRSTCYCGNIVEELPISQSTVSQHLRELKEAGLIKGTIEGASVCYCIDGKEWMKAERALSEFFGRFKETDAVCR